MRYREALLDLMISNLVAMRASVDSAIRLGPHETRVRIDRVIHRPLPEFMALIGNSLPDRDRVRSRSTDRLLRRVIAAALLEHEFSPVALRAQLREILDDTAAPGRGPEPA